MELIIKIPNYFYIILSNVQNQEINLLLYTFKSKLTLKLYFNILENLYLSLTVT